MRSLRTGIKKAIPGFVLVFAGLAIVLFFKSSSRSQIEVDVKSEYSYIRIRRRGNFRELLFVRDDGKEVRQSGLNLDAPHKLTSPYARVMFASYLFKPRQERVLIIGLGGGSMVRFLNHHEPDLHVDVVEIDPVVVRLADEYFDARAGDHVNIMTTDGFDYLRETEQRYDVIYFDAFLKPSEDTDDSGVPRKLKTIAFYKSVQGKLKPNGVVVFNINAHAKTDDDIRTIGEVFPQTAVFSCSGATNVVAIGSMSSTTEDPSVLQERAKELDERFKATFSFQELLNGRLQ